MFYVHYRDHSVLVRVTSLPTNLPLYLHGLCPPLIYSHGDEPINGINTVHTRISLLSRTPYNAVGASQPIVSRNGGIWVARFRVHGVMVSTSVDNEHLTTHNKYTVDHKTRLALTDFCSCCIISIVNKMLHELIVLTVKVPTSR